MTTQESILKFQLHLISGSSHKLHGKRGSGRLRSMHFLWEYNLIHTFFLFSGALNFCTITLDKLGKG